MHVYLHARTAVDRHMHLKPRLFWLREKLKDPQFEPHAGIKMAQVLGSLVYIYDSIMNTYTKQNHIVAEMTAITYGGESFWAGSFCPTRFFFFFVVASCLNIQLISECTNFCMNSYQAHALCYRRVSTVLVEIFARKYFWEFGSGRHFASFYFCDCPQGIAYSGTNRPNE